MPQIRICLVAFLFLSSFALGGPVLNTKNFAACLQKERVDKNLSNIRHAYHFNELDGLLLFLSAYPSKRLWGPTGIPQDRARRIWSGKWEHGEKALAALLLRAAQRETLRPNQVFQMAVSTCRHEDAFCASLLLHNVFRTLGRYRQGYYRAPFRNQIFDLNPTWFHDETNYWTEKAPEIQLALMPLRPGQRGDRWGEWYHFFGVFAYAAHALSLEGHLASASLAVKMGELLNPLLARGPEEKEKAQLDRDAVTVAWRYYRSKDSSPTADCESDLAYLAER